MSLRTPLLLSSALVAALIMSPHLAEMASSSPAPKTVASTTLLMKQRIDRASRWIFTADQLKNESDLEKDLEEYRLNAAERRANCRKDLLSANRDTSLGVVLKCLSVDFQQEKAILAKQIAEAPLGTTHVTAIKLSRAQTNLSNALSAMIQAIDSDVFRTEASLRDALKNLLMKYRAPIWRLQELSRKERQLSGISSLLLRTTTLTGSLLQTDAWKTSVACLYAKEAELLGTGSTLAGSGKTLGYCMNQLEISLIPPPPVLTGSGATASGSAKAASGSMMKP